MQQVNHLRVQGSQDLEDLEGLGGLGGLEDLTLVRILKHAFYSSITSQSSAFNVEKFSALCLIVKSV